MYTLPKGLTETELTTLWVVLILQCIYTINGIVTKVGFAECCTHKLAPEPSFTYL